MNPLDQDLQFQITLANPNVKFRTRKDGAHYLVEFELNREEWDYFVDANLQGMVLEALCEVTHRNTEEKPEVKLRLKAIELCGQQEFQHFLQCEYCDFPLTENNAVAVFKRLCGISSRSELDVNHEAAGKFAELRTKFANWKRDAHQAR